MVIWRLEGRVYSDLYSNTSEDMFIRTMMESSVGIRAPTMEMRGFRNPSSNFRTDSEELVKNWLTTGEVIFFFESYRVHIYYNYLMPHNPKQQAGPITSKST